MFHRKKWWWKVRESPRNPKENSGFQDLLKKIAQRFEPVDFEKMRDIFRCFKICGGNFTYFFEKKIAPKLGFMMQNWLNAQMFFFRWVVKNPIGNHWNIGVQESGKRLGDTILFTGPGPGPFGPSWEPVVFATENRPKKLPFQKLGRFKAKRVSYSSQFFFFRGELAVRFRECIYTYIYNLKILSGKLCNPYPGKDILCLHLKIIGTYPHHTLGLHCVEPNSPIFSPSRARPIWLIQRPTNWRWREAAKSQCLKWFLFRKHACAIFLAGWCGMNRNAQVYIWHPFRRDALRVPQCICKHTYCRYQFDASPTTLQLPISLKTRTHGNGSSLLEAAESLILR